MIYETIPKRSGEAVAGSGTAYLFSGGLALGATAVAGYETQSPGVTSVNSFRPLSGLPDAFHAAPARVTIVEIKQGYPSDIPRTYLPSEYPGELVILQRERGRSLFAFLADVESQSDRPSFPSPRAQLYRDWFEVEPSSLELKRKDFSEFLKHHIERARRDIGRSSKADDILSEDISVSEVVLEEESIEIRPRIAFGSLPIPGKPKSIRLTERVRSALPPEALPRSFSVPISEESEP